MSEYGWGYGPETYEEKALNETIDQLRAENADLVLESEDRQRRAEKYRYCLEWLHHLYMGISRHGGEPTQAEWEDAWGEVGEALREVE
jgi:hypothetical protein